MQKISLFFTFLFFFALSSVSGQTLQLKHDLYGNAYILKPDRLEKLNPKGEKICQFDLPQSAYITSFDVSNPMRILIFSSDFNTVLFLDKYLNPVSEAFELDKINRYQNLLACTASRGGFWIYDADNHQVVHVDPLGNTDLSSGEIQQNQSKPIFLQEQNRQLYLAFDDGRLMVFNAYAAYEKTLPFNFTTPPLIQNDTLFFINEQTLFAYDFVTAELNVMIELPYVFHVFSIVNQQVIYPQGDNLKRINLD